MSKYTAVFDNGNPYEVKCANAKALKREMKKFYKNNKGEDNSFDVLVYNEKGKDISETQFVQELATEILEEEGE